MRRAFTADRALHSVSDLSRARSCGYDDGDATAMRKKVDARIRTLIENGGKLRHRSMFVIVGDGGR